MKLTKFKEKETKKKVILISTGIVLIISLVFVAVSYSLFQKEDEGIVADGTVARGTSLLKATSYSDKTAFRSDTYKEKIKNITFEDEINIRDNKIEEWDISEAQDGSIISYVVPNETEGYYDLYIQSNRYIEANPDMSYWFSEFSLLETINGLEFLDTSNVTDMRAMFYYCKSLTSLDLSNFNTKNVTTMINMFRACKSLEILDLSSFDTSKVTNMLGMFSMYYKNDYAISKLREIKGLENFNTSKVTDMSYMFQYCKSLEILDLSSFDTGKVTDMRCMFNMFYSGDNTTSKLKEIKGLEHFNTSKVTNMSDMFNNCKSLEILDLSSFDTSNVIDMSYMFNMFYKNDNTTSKLKEIKGLENFDTSKVTSMQSMFQHCKNLKMLDLSNFDTSNVIDMSYMFAMFDSNDTTGIYGKLAEIKGLEHFNTSKVTDMQLMFYGCIELTSLDLSSFDTSKVTNMKSMFSLTGYSSTIFTLDLGDKFDTSNVTDMQIMFYYTGYNSTKLNIELTIRNEGLADSNYQYMFSGVATKPGSKITVNYTKETSDLVDKMIATKSTNSNVVKGVQVD